jgi:hypothetical protein
MVIVLTVIPGMLTTPLIVIDATSCDRTAVTVPGRTPAVMLTRAVERLPIATRQRSAELLVQTVDSQAVKLAFALLETSADSKPDPARTQGADIIAGTLGGDKDKPEGRQAHPQPSFQGEIVVDTPVSEHEQLSAVQVTVTLLPHWRGMM